MMWFHVRVLNADGSYQDAKGDSGSYPVGQTRVIDIAETGIFDNSTLAPWVGVAAGSDKNGLPVVYKKNGQVATYKVSGTTWNFSVELV